MREAFDLLDKSANVSQCPSTGLVKAQRNVATWGLAIQYPP